MARMARTDTISTGMAAILILTHITIIRIITTPIMDITGIITTGPPPTTEVTISTTAVATTIKIAVTVPAAITATRPGQVIIITTGDIS